MAAVTYRMSEEAEELGRIMSHADKVSITSEKDCQVYKRRWLMLALYMLCAVADEMHWLHYAITSQTVTKYYGISDYIVDLTATMYGITFVVFVFPAIWLIEKYGLKRMLILGDVLVIAGSGMKLGSLNPEYFYIGFCGQILTGIAQVFIVNVPSYLAGLWFPKNEVSTACALGVLGTQIGNALSFFIPPQLIALGEATTVNGEKDTKQGLLYVYIYLIILPVALLPFLIFVFKSEPPKPPSYARLHQPATSKRGKTKIRELAKNKNYVLIVLSYSINVSVFYCMSTFLNQIITNQEFAGTLGAVIVVFGVVGCFIFGWLLDKTHKFKMITLGTYVLATVGLIMFWVSVVKDFHAAVFITSGVIIGIFLTSYVIIAIEFSSEVTYPISETISTSVLLACGEFLSIILIYTSALLLENYGTYTIICTTLAFMLIGLIPTSMATKIQLKRHEASIVPHISLKRQSHTSSPSKEQPGQKADQQVDKGKSDRSPTASPSKEQRRQKADQQVDKGKSDVTKEDSTERSLAATQKKQSAAN